MKVTVTLEFPTPTYAQVREYLERSGWQLIGTHPPRNVWATFDRVSAHDVIDMDGRSSINVPCVVLADFDRRMSEVVEDLAGREGRRADEVAKDILGVTP